MNITHLTPEEISIMRSGYRPHPRSRLMLDPATGALVVKPECRAEIEKALMREVRRLQMSLYLYFARLYLAKLWLEALGHFHNLIGGLYRLLPQRLRNRL